MDSDTLKQVTKAFDYLFDSVVVTDLQGIITDWNKGSEALYGYPKKEAIGQPVSMLHLTEDSEHITSEVIAAVTKFGKWTGEVRMRHKTGNIGWIESMCVPIYNSDKQITGALGVNRDITARMQETTQLKHLAHYDHLTKIPNRSLLFERVEHLIAQSERNKGTFALLFIDLDKFKAVNDTKGHAVGDQVLIEASVRLKQLIRNSDTVARIGGDEFVVLLENIADRSNVATVVETVSTALNRPYEIAGEKLDVSCSIGVANYPFDGTMTDALIAAADQAMYEAKKKK